MTSAGRRGAVCAIVLLAFLSLVPGLARAHTPDLSQSQFSGEDRVVRAILVFHWQDAVRLGKELGGAADGGAARPRGDAAFAAVIGSGVSVTANGARCAGALVSAEPTEGDGFAFVATYSCAAPITTLVVDLPLLERFPASHRHLARVTLDTAGVERTLSGSDHAVTVRAVPSAPAELPSESSVMRVLRAVGLGGRHILTGWDHLLFLFVLVLGLEPRGFRGLLVPVTAFSVAHSVTLALAALSVVSPSPRFVEPAILFSVVFLALENGFGVAATHRERLTFPFGLLHGLGFAAGLRELGLEPGRLVSTLFGFNLGVELGQLATLPLLLWAARALRRQDAALPRQASLAVGAVALVGAFARLGMFGSLNI